MKVPVSALRAGFIFSKPVRIDADNLFVPAGVEIREKDIEQLRAWGIEEVETDGNIIGESFEDASTPNENDAVQAKAAEGQAGANPAPVSGGQPGARAGQARTGQTVGQDNPAPASGMEQSKVAFMGRVITEEQKIDIIFQNYLDFIRGLDDFFVCIASNDVPNIQSVFIIADGLLRAIKENRVTTIGYILGSEVQRRDLAKNSINIAILSALIAERLKFSDENIRQLVIGALLHDIGMLRLPKVILDKSGWLSPTETQQIQMHPFYSYSIVCEELKLSEYVGRIVSQHHERWDGEGYPRHFRGQEIAMSARIVSVVDAFEAMVSEKPYRNSMMGYHAMKNILSDNSRRFDPDVLKAFVGIMGIYPIGSIIRLNTGAVARVTDVRGEASLRPKIRIIIDENGMEIQPKEGTILDLLKEKSLFITRSLDPREFAKRA
jgi:HD-GYP domain-containing protein (c-di-GMP phosphodiesterase class II)